MCRSIKQLRRVDEPPTDAEMQAAVEEAKAGIAAGEISVHDYMSDNACPAS